MMAYNDSLDKIFLIYFAAFTQKVFSYNSITVQPKPLLVSPLLLRGYTCPSGCGGCCPKFSLDYLSNKPRSKSLLLKERIVLVNENEFFVFSDQQLENNGNRCKFLNKNTGRCNIYFDRPFSCDFELIKVIREKNRNILLQKLFSRGWAMKRTSGGRGALCEIFPPNELAIKEVVRKLNVLKQWMSFFKINHKIDKVLRWIEIDGNNDIII